MECFIHEGHKSIGLCKSCYKAVCRDCAIDVEHGLACSEECVTDVAELNEMNERGKKIYGIGPRKSKMPSSGVIIWCLFSILFWGMAAIPYFKTGHIDYGSLAMAIVFTIIAVIAFFSVRRTGLQC